MSRCFPFPPPGYEKKPRIDDVDSLIKEKDKDKEKKHKKEKKDKKKEGKEKKDKESRKDKHREKKDRKEKKKDKDKKKDKAKTKTDEKKTDGQQPEGHSKGGKHGENSQQDANIKDKIEGKFEGHYRWKQGENTQQDANIKEKKLYEQSEASRGKHIENIQHDTNIKDSKFAMEFSRRIGDEENGRRNQMVENCTSNELRKVDGMGRMVEKNIDNRVQGKVYMDKKGHEKKTDRQEIKDEKLPTSTLLPSITRVDQRSVGSMAGLMEKDAEKKIGLKENNKGKDGDDKQKNRNGEHKSKGKDKHRDKEKREIEEIKLEERKSDKMTESHKDPKNILNIKPPQIPIMVKSAGIEENHRKRKDSLTNGFLHENDVRPSKALKPTITSQPLNGSGRKIEPCQTAMHEGSNNLRLVNKEQKQKINGVVEAQASSISSRTSSSTVKDCKNIETISEPPHPDSKYLSQIFTVPKMDEWMEFDDQEWLFRSSNLQSKIPQVTSFTTDNDCETTQVWDKAQKIESVDVYALPYVIPY